MMLNKVAFASFKSQLKTHLLSVKILSHPGQVILPGDNVHILVRGLVVWERSYRGDF